METLKSDEKSNGNRLLMIIKIIKVNIENIRGVLLPLLLKI